jgi:hypothetical protein
VISSDAEFVTDLHVRRVAADRIRDQIVERLLLFDDAQDRAQLAQVLKLGLVEQVLRAARDDGGRIVGCARVGERAPSVAPSHRNAGLAHTRSTSAGEMSRIACRRTRR